MASKFQHWEYLTGTDWSGADLNLANISGAPARQPDELHVRNVSTDTDASLVINTSKGNACTYPVPFGGAIQAPLRLDTLSIDQTTTSTVEVVAFWNYSTKFNP